eukprot:Skav228593  [mRNA]  locus=scaffold1161:70199:75552:+ [translate_table: standard]
MTEDLKKELLRKGGTLADWELALTGGIALSDQQWNDSKTLGQESQETARRIMAKGNLVEYECYDNRGGKQGKAVIRLEEWDDYGKAFLKASHILASDGYYDYYARDKLKDGKGVYHICGDRRRTCKEKLVRGDRRELVHIERWRLITPMMMIEGDYTGQLGMRALEEWVKDFRPTVPEPAAPPGRVDPGGGQVARGSGVDAALAGLPDEELGEGKRGRALAKEVNAPRVISPKGSVGMLLEKKAADHRAAVKAKDEKQKKQKKERDRSRSRRRRRKGKSSEDSLSKSSASSRGDFRMPSTRGEDELWRRSQKNPGRLLRSGMEELQRFLANRSEGATEEEGHWLQYKMMGYVNQVILDSSGSLAERAELEHSSPFGADTISRGFLDNRGRSQKSGEAGAHNPKVEGAHPAHARRRNLQIGTGRREVFLVEESRDATGTEESRERAGGKESELRGEGRSDRRRKPSAERGREEEPRQEKRPAVRLVERTREMEEAEEGQRKRQRKVEVKDEEPEPDTDEGAGEVTTAGSSDVENEVEEALGVMREWLKSEETGGLSAAQSGALLALAAHRSETALGHYLGRCVSGPRGLRTKRQRGLLPLPLMDDSVEELQKLFATGEFKKLAGPAGSGKKSRVGKEKAGKATRRSGLLIWHALVTTVINVMWTGGGRTGRVHSGPVSKAQEDARQRLWNSVKVFLDDGSESQEKVPRSLAVGEWGAKLGDVRISYHGEVVEKGQKLTLAQILPGLPPPGYGGRVELAELCEGELRRKLEDPMGNLLMEEELPEEIPAPRVYADQEQWDLIAKELLDRGLVEPVEDPLVMRGKVLTNGAFGVVKPGKYLSDDRPVLRLIMDFRGVNSVTKVLEGDVRTLTGAPALQHVVLPGGKVLRVSADDLVAAFYLFGLPRGWSRMMTFGPKVSWKKLGIDREGDVHIGARVLPMGWASAVGVLQHAHRRLALRSPLAGGGGLLAGCEIRRDSEFPDMEVEESLWSLYLDDMSLVEVMDRRVAKELSGKPPEEQQRLRAAYTQWGIPYNLEKAKERAAKAEKLGAILDGDAGLLKSSMKRAIDSISLGFWLLRQEKVPRKALQVFLGKETHTIQFRRPLFAIFDYLWKDIGGGESMIKLGAKSVEEILLAGFSQALRFTDLRATLNEVVTASDASESGGGLVYGAKLTKQGLKDSLAVERALEEEPAEEGDLNDPQKILVIDLFAGIGGLSRALELAQVKVERLVVVENDKKCRHLHKVRWPGCDVWLDVRRVTRRDVEKAMRGVPGLTGVICGGGSPCQGLSKLSSNREHLEDERSKLFFDLVKIENWVKEIAEEMSVWVLNFCENVVADDQDVKEMSDALKMVPVQACSSHVSRVRRPRLFWSNVRLLDHPSYTRAGLGKWDEVILEAPVEPLELVPDKGWKWKSAEADDALKLPTFTRAIPRVRPPAKPAGITQCSEKTLELWRKDKMKFPPYTYKPEFLFENRQLPGQVRVASSTERERLMGFPSNYTEALFKKEASDETEVEKMEVERQAALGNSFHALVLASLIDLWLWSMGVRLDPLTSKVIVKQWHEKMGQAMGPLTPSQVSDSEGAPSEAELSEAASELAPKRAEWLRLSQDPTLGMGDTKVLNLRLVHQFLRRTEFRGSDVRLDLQVAYRPDAMVRTTINPDRWIWEVAQAYPWRHPEHINVLELRSILKMLEWRARTSTFHSTRFLHLSDSQVCLAVLTKGRSSSRRINRLLRRVHALCLGLNVYPLWAWIASRLNPADEPSRRYAKKH